MSLSKPASFEHAQATIKCDHCGGVDDVKHYCLICEETICPTCKSIHNKARATRDHHVVLRKERHTKDQSSTFCKKHPDQRTILHCDTCNVPACMKCVAETHNGHKFSDISTILENYKREIAESKNKMKTRIYEVNALITKGEQNWKDYESIVKSIESSILEDTAALCSLVHKMAQARTDDLNIITQQDRTIWEKVKGRLNEEKTKISTSLAQHDKCLSSPTITGMAELLEESQVLRGKLLDYIDVVPPCYKSPSYTSIEGIGEITRQTKVPSVVPISKFNVVKAEIISTFTITLKGFPSICYGGNGQVLIGTTQSMDINFVDKEGEIKQKRENVLLGKCRYLTVSQSGDIFFSPTKGNVSYKLDRLDKVTALLDVYPYESYFQTVTKQEEILVCLKYSVGKTSKGRVILCDGKGGHIRHIGSDDLYENPKQAVVLHDGGFCISDFGKEQLLVLNGDGNIRHIIRDPLGRRGFWPYGICTDKAGNILATDKKNHCVYVVGKDMSVRELVGKAEGIQNPRCLCVDDDNNLWIAQNYGEIKVVTYLQEH